MSALCLNTPNFLSGSNNVILLHNLLLDGKLPPAIENGIVWLNWKVCSRIASSICVNAKREFTCQSRWRQSSERCRSSLFGVPVRQRANLILCTLAWSATSICDRYRSRNLWSLLARRFKSQSPNPLLMLRWIDRWIGRGWFVRSSRWLP